MQKYNDLSTPIFSILDGKNSDTISAVEHPQQAGKGNFQYVFSVRIQSFNARFRDFMAFTQEISRLASKAEDVSSFRCFSIS